MFFNLTEIISSQLELIAQPKRKMIMRVAVLILLGAFISGCSTTAGMKNQVDQMNNQLQERYSPVRAKFTDLGNGATSFQMGVWAGEPGESAFSGQHKDLVLGLVEKSCGFSEDSLIETRIVSHQDQLWYEVWVFKDPSSERKDKQKGISVVVSYDPSTNQSRTTLYGGCKPEEK